MQKLSGWTAFIIVCVSLGISKYLSLAKQTSLPTLETPTEFITSPSSNRSSKLISIAEQTSLLTLETPTELITPPSLNKPPKPIYILEQEVFEQVNKYRVSRHLPPFTLDSRISEQARIYSQAMASGKVPFGQEGLELHTEAISNVIPYQGIAENVVYNFGYSDPVRTAVTSWLRNPDRGLVSIEGQYELTGIGVATNIKGYYFTQIFIHR